MQAAAQKSIEKGKMKVPVLQRMAFPGSPQPPKSAPLQLK